MSELNATSSNFLRQIIERDLASGYYANRRWVGSPGDAAHHAAAPLDTARIRTRFPPEPNGYLHIGHAKSICLNFGLALQYQGICHLRFDDTNPEKENQEYVDAIMRDIHWLGFRWQTDEASYLYYASDYFDFMYRAAEYLIETNLAYVDEQSAEDMRRTRGTLTEPGTPSPWRNRPANESLQRFREMRAGQYPDGTMVLRAKIDMAAPNINMRDPAIYRIKHAHHHRSGDTWCIYPMYTYAHPIEDALEQITHSICTLEFEDQRPFYNWLLEHLAAGGLLTHPLPQQNEFARLNLTHVMTSKRKLAQLVQEQHVSGWDDPRMPTLAGLRRRGYTPAALQLFAERIGVSKADSWIDYTVLEAALRDDLEEKTPRAMAVLKPLKLKLTNWQAIFGDQPALSCQAPRHPHHDDWGHRHFDLTPELWIEQDDFMEQPVKGYRRLFPGNVVRLKYAYVVTCTGCERDATGKVVCVHAEIIPDTKSGTPGADLVKAKGVITWVSATQGIPATVRWYRHLFLNPYPATSEADLAELLNPESQSTLQAWLESTLQTAQPETHFQFERHGYFVVDNQDSQPGAPVFNLAVSLKEQWSS